MCLSRLRLLALCSLQEWVARSRLIRCPAPLPETALEPVLLRMLEGAPTEGSDGEDKGAITSPKGASEEEGIKNSSFQGGRGPPPKIRRPKPLNGGRDLHRGVRRLGRIRTYNHHQRISPPTSREYEKGSSLVRKYLHLCFCG